MLQAGTVALTGAVGRGGGNAVSEVNATNPGAGPAPANFAHEVQQIITACEIIEAGSGGRVSGPPSCATARDAGLLRTRPAHRWYRGRHAAAQPEYRRPLRPLRAGSTGPERHLHARTGQHYNAIYNQVPQGGAATDAALVALASAYINTNGQRFHVETGLFDTAIVAMLRTAQFRRHLAGQPVGAEVALTNAALTVAQRAEVTARVHCERHQLGGGAPALFVRTMNTVAHDEQGDPIPTCHWEVFRLAPEPVRHLGSLSVCRFRVDGGCVVGLDDARATTHTCLAADGMLRPPR